MSDESVEPPKPKNKGGRPRKQPTVTMTQDQFNVLMSRISTLEQQVTETPGEIVVTTATPGAPTVPGSYFNVGTAERPDLHKVRWSKRDIERIYPMVTFRPIVTVTVGPHGIPYDLTANKEVTVPSIVQTFHDEYIATQEAEGRKYRSLSFAENVALAERAMDDPGHQIWSRLFRRPGSLFMNSAETADESQP